MHNKLTQSQSPSEGEDSSSSSSVYVTEPDTSLYDVMHPEYRQIHCLRVEIERTKGHQAVKITDIDYYLEGNRHAKAKSEDLLA
jgi:hypothetical protein